MYKNYTCRKSGTRLALLTKFLIMSKFSVLLVLVCVFDLHAKGFGQSVNLKKEHISIKEAFKEIRKQTGYNYLWAARNVENATTIAVNLNHVPLASAIQSILKDLPLQYQLKDNTILITEKQQLQQAAASLQDTVRGIVTDSLGQPLAGVSVTLAGTRRGTTTNANGVFSLAPINGINTLVFSYTGFLRTQAQASPGQPLTIVLKENPQQLDEIVVVAYGTAKKKDFTGSITSISSESIQQQQVSSVSQALEGAAPGLQISSSTGQPGNDAVLRVRGMGSINASNDPLIVVDGAVTNLPLSSLNPNDIASIVISKDAAANAIYGSRAANGLILVTTKKGQTGKPSINFGIRTGATSQGVPDYDVIRDPATYYEYTWKGIYNYRRYNQGYSDADSRQYASDNLFTANGASNSGNGLGNYMNYSIADGETLIDPTTGKIRSDATLLYHDDWQDYFLQTAFRQEYNTDISGATQNTDYYVSLGLLKNPSFVMGSDFNRYSGRINLNTKITSWLKGGANMSYARTYSNAPSGYTGGTVNTNIFTFMNLFAPTYPIYAYDDKGNIILDVDGRPTYDLGTNQTYSPYGSTARSSFNGYSPAVYFEKDLTETNNDYFSGRGFIEATFLNDFKFTADISIANQYRNYKYYGNNESGADARDYGGYITGQWSKAMTLNMTQLLTWDKDFGAHHLDVLVGHEFNKSQSDYMNGTKYKMYALDNPSMENAVRALGLDGGDAETALEGYLSRFNYNYASKYYLSASLRRDGSSYFRNKRWGTFWSIGGSYRLSEESFIKENNTWLNDLRIRGSYGVQGNNGLPASARYAWTNTYALSSSGSLTDADFVLAANTWGDPSITWESNHIIDAGLDFRLWDRFYGNVDYFHRKTVDMLLSVSYPASAGRAGALRNVGQLLNTGFELELGVDILKKQDFSWSFNINASHYRTKLLEIPDNMGSKDLDGGYLAGNYLRRPGTDYFNLYLYRYAGVDQESGLGLLYKQLKEADMVNYPDHSVGDIVTTTEGSQATRFELGTASPDLVGGLSTNVRYKQFDLGILASWQLGGKVVSRTYQYLTSQSIGRGAHLDMLDAWTPENPNSNIPMVMFGGTNYGSQPIGGGEGQYSDFSLFSAHYFNLKSVTLGYTLPASLAERWFLKGLRVYVSGENIFFRSAKKGLDPRQVIDGTTISPFNYPQTKAISLGLNIQI